jgi:regulator of protease activity HflC (stomatin/prohibitin superfamily)
MKNPFKKAPGRYPYGYGGTANSSRSLLGSNKLKIFAGIVTFIILTIVVSESIVIVQAGHRGVVLYLGATENRVLGEGLHFIVPFAQIPS